MGEGSWIGLDVHARGTAAAVVDGVSGEVMVARAPVGVDELVEWVRAHRGPVRVAYEAGPTGFGLSRALEAVGVGCVVAAPSLIPRSVVGRGRKRDASDAEQLARSLRLGELVAVRVPDARDEAARDLVRAREDARGDLMRARHRLSKLLLRHGRVFDGRAWTLAHDAWLRRQVFEHPGSGAAFDDYYQAVLTVRLRRDGLDEKIAEMACDPRFAPVVCRLGCLRGVGTFTAFALCIEIGDWTRLTGATIGAYLGLVPSEHQSGQKHARGADHQGRQQPHPQAVGGIGVASPPTPPRQPGVGATPSRATTRSQSPRRAGRTAPAPAVAASRETPRSALHHCCGRRCPRTRRVLLEPRRDGRLTPTMPRMVSRARRPACRTCRRGARKSCW